jgi:hypothetical protein
MAEEQLDGGIANAGQVVRAGQHVLRPSSRHSASIHAFLQALRQAGFDGAPSPVGIDADGREHLVFIAGDVPRVPYPAWCQTAEALASVARLLRRFHDAAICFDASRFAWNGALADPAGGTIVCHNDLEPSNVVFDDGVAVAMLDFEFAAPGRAIYDLAVLARMWVPIDHDIDRDRVGWFVDDLPARLRLVADAYGLGHGERIGLMGAIGDAMDRVEAAVRAGVAAGHIGTVELWNRSGGATRFQRRRGWWDEHSELFAAALIA